MESSSLIQVVVHLSPPPPFTGAKVSKINHINKTPNFIEFSVYLDARTPVKYELDSQYMEVEINRTKKNIYQTPIPGLHMLMKGQQSMVSVCSDTHIAVV